MAEDPWAVASIQKGDPWAVAAVEPLKPSRAPLLGLQAATGEAALHFGAGIAGGIAGGYAGLVQGAKNLIEQDPTNMSAADRVRQVQGMISYEPRSAEAQALTAPMDWLAAKPAEAGDFGGREVSELASLNRVPAPVAAGLGVATNVGIQAVPMLLGARAAPKVPGRAPPLPGEYRAAAGTAETLGTAEALKAAETYVSTHAPTVNWNALPQAFKESLTEIAKSATGLENLNPQAVARQARMESLAVPMQGTLGQITRDPVQLRNEGNVSATDTGKPIRDRYVSQNKAIIDNLNVIKGETRATATSAEETGGTIQGAARGKLAMIKARTSRLYKAADRSPETLQKVDTTPLFELIEKTPDTTQFGYALSWMKKVGAEPGTGMTIRDLESLRKEAVVQAKDGGTKGHHAGELIKAIDKATEGAGGKLYKAARASRNAQALEFEEQAGVERLVENKSRTDPAVALEDTWRRTVVGGSIADLVKVKKSLLEGGTPKTQALGRKAWQEMQGATIDHIIDTATRSATKFEDGTPNLTAAALKQGIETVGKAKIDVQFGPGMYARLQNILEATVDVKTKPPPGFEGSSTVANALALMERTVGKIPYLGRGVTGTIELAAKVKDFGEAGRQVRAAVSNPLLDTAAQLRREGVRAEAINSLLREAPRGTAAAQAAATRRD